MTSATNDVNLKYAWNLIQKKSSSDNFSVHPSSLLNDKLLLFRHGVNRKWCGLKFSKMYFNSHQDSDCFIEQRDSAFELFVWLNTLWEAYTVYLLSQNSYMYNNPDFMYLTMKSCITTMRPRENGRHFTRMCHFGCPLPSVIPLRYFIKWLANIGCTTNVKSSILVDNLLKNTWTSVKPDILPIQPSKHSSVVSNAMFWNSRCTRVFKSWLIDSGCTSLLHFDRLVLRVMACLKARFVIGRIWPSWKLIW